MSIAEARKKSTLYVGGLDEEVTEKVLHSAFIPFGDLVDVQIPRDLSSNKPRGFGFVDFEEEEDAKEAMDNMNQSELYGRVLTVNIAKPQAMSSNRAVWEEQADEWIEGNMGEKVDEEGEGDGGDPAAE